MTQEMPAASDRVAVLEETVNLLEAAIADTNRRLAAAERRSAHEIEAVSNEIKRTNDRIPSPCRCGGLEE